MRVVAITGPQQCQLVDKPDLKATDDFVAVKILAAPMCTEYKLYKSGTGPGKVNDCLGHEAAGEVVEVGRPGKHKVGDKVVAMPLYACGKCELCVTGDYIHCQKGAWPKGGLGAATYAQYLLKPDWMLLPVPADIPLHHAAMTCCGLGPTFGAMQRMSVDAFDTVLITGMGPVGLGGVINATFRGARVIAVESQPYRQELARKLGAALVVDPTDPKAALQTIRDFTVGRGVDKAVDCTGVPAAQRLLIDAARRRGHVAFVGEGADLSIHVSNDMLRKGLTLHGVWHWNLNDTDRIYQAIRGSARKIDQLITHVMPMRDVQKAWELQLTGNCGKIILQPWE